MFKNSKLLDTNANHNDINALVAVWKMFKNSKLLDTNANHNWIECGKSARYDV